MGDRPKIPEHVPVTAPSPVQTVAEITPTEIKEEGQVQGPTFQSVVPSTLLNAHYIRDTITDGTVIEPETRFTQIWTLQNPGPYAWPAGCRVRYVGGDNMLNVDNSHPASVAIINAATESNVIDRVVAVGDEVSFQVTLQAPVREGKAISYWRVKSADGTPFGHRLWCDVEVKKAEQVTVPIHSATLPLPIPPRLPLPSIPAYDSMNVTSRLAVMREQQKQRREQMIAQLNAQRDQFGVTREDLPTWAQLGTSAGVSKTFENMNDKDRREALRQRVAHIKANIIRTREEREKLTGEIQKQKKAGEESAKVKKIVEEVAKQLDVEDPLSGSQMVFPKLDKESPSNSTYVSATSSSNVEKIKTSSSNEEKIKTSSPTVEDDFIDLTASMDELEVLSANDDESDDGFLTDEEYDILDASDQESGGDFIL
jgi:next-to-BRCA1 protein 1